MRTYVRTRYGLGRWVFIAAILLCGWQAAAFASAGDATPTASKPAKNAAGTKADDPAARFPADAPTTYNPNTVKEWFDKTYFNLLVDYYTEIPGRPYGTGMTLENLTKSLRMCRPGYVMFYAKGHSGTTAFKSRLGTEHPMLGDDPLAVLRQATRQCGVKLVLYYSGLIDGSGRRAASRMAARRPRWQTRCQARRQHSLSGWPRFARVHVTWKTGLPSIWRK